jgi:hypothetical protein
MREMLEAFEDWFYEVPAERIIPVLLKIALGVLLNAIALGVFLNSICN